ncbi:hypothetical protein D9M68_801870 [compost metagenome]
MFSASQILHQADEKPVRFTGTHHDAWNFSFAQSLKGLEAPLATDDLEELIITFSGLRHRDRPLESNRRYVLNQFGENLFVANARIEHSDLVERNQADGGLFSNM